MTTAPPLAGLAERWQALHPEANDAQLAFEHNRFLRAPVVIAVVSQRLADHVFPSGQSARRRGGQNLLVAASLAGGRPVAHRVVHL